MKNFIQGLKNLIIGKPHDIKDKTIFHKISLIAFFAWVGLGADGLSSSCYGPQESFLALGAHPYLAIFVGLGVVFTIFIISASYSQIVELFPAGGGGYFVATKLLSPRLGMISGCALLIDYVLTVSVSIAAGADAIFSLLPLQAHVYRIYFVVLILVIMVVLNMRGAKESVLPLIPIFLTFVITHVFIILYGFLTHITALPQIVMATKADVVKVSSELGFWGMIFLLLHAYSMGAGTYTGIEAVSNGIPVLREPKVETAKRTMRYMTWSLSFVVFGLMLCYIFYNIGPQAGKTLNAIFLENATASWGVNTAHWFILVTLISETVILFVAAQTGFLGGPRVLANMSQDHWFPIRFSMLSDRFVTQNGILIIGILSFATLIFSRGSLRLLVILYSINVFITFVLSQAGMVRHWWTSRSTSKGWMKKISVSGAGLILCGFILSSMVIVKFKEGGWVTLLITGLLVAIALLIKRHYSGTLQLLQRLNTLVAAVETSESEKKTHGHDENAPVSFDPKAKTAVLLVNGFNGLGLHTLFGVMRLFGGVFKNFIFVQIGAVDAGNFRSTEEMDNLKSKIHGELDRYIKFMNKNGFYAKGYSEIGVDIIEEVEKLSNEITSKFKNVVFFGGQLIFPKETFVSRLLHNYTVFALQKRLYRNGMPFVILPIRVG